MDEIYDILFTTSSDELTCNNNEISSSNINILSDDFISDFIQRIDTSSIVLLPFHIDDTYIYNIETKPLFTNLDNMEVSKDELNSKELNNNQCIISEKSIENNIKQVKQQQQSTLILFDTSFDNMDDFNKHIEERERILIDSVLNESDSDSDLEKDIIITPKSIYQKEIKKPIIKRKYTKRRSNENSSVKSKSRIIKSISKSTKRNISNANANATANATTNTTTNLNNKRISIRNSRFVEVLIK